MGVGGAELKTNNYDLFLLVICLTDSPIYPCIYPFLRPFIGVITSFTTGTRMGPPCWILFCWWFPTDSTMVNQHEKPPFERIILGTFSKASEMKQIQGPSSNKTRQQQHRLLTLPNGTWHGCFLLREICICARQLAKKRSKFDILFFGMD